VQLPETSRTDCTRTLGDIMPLVLPVAPAVEPVLEESGVVEVADPLVPIEPLDESSVPVTWTFLPTCFVSFSLSFEMSL
jgi:hypothetical protein